MTQILVNSNPIIMVVIKVVYLKKYKTSTLGFRNARKGEILCICFSALIFWYQKITSLYLNFD